MCDFQALLPLVRARKDDPGTIFGQKWLVWRWDDIDSVQPIKARPYLNTHEFFHITSNSCRNILDLGLDIDIEVDLSPFVQCNKSREGQAEYVFTASLPYLETEPLK